MKKGIIPRVNWPGRSYLLVLVVVITLGLSGVAWAHQTQGSPVDKWCSQNQGKVCLSDTTHSPTLQATYTGSDATYVGNVYPTTSHNLNQSVVNVGNLGSSCTVFIRDLPNFGGWVRSIPLGQGLGFGSGSPYYRDTSSHHWCSSGS